MNAAPVDASPAKSEPVAGQPNAKTGGEGGGDPIQCGSGIFLGYPFDQLLNGKCPLDGVGTPGIKLPDLKQGEPGSGNIVICGPPGSAKSTLALQFAVACVALRRNQGGLKKDDEDKRVKEVWEGPYNAAYISLEQEPDQVLAKARIYEWDKYFVPLRHLHQVPETSSSADLASVLARVLSQPKDNGGTDCLFQEAHKDAVDRREGWDAHCQCPRGHRVNPAPGRPSSRILLPTLAPRPVSPSAAATSDLFQERYQQLEHLLSAAYRLRKDHEAEHKGKDAGSYLAPLRMVCIDSLNMFGSRPLAREEMFRLFDLFRRYEIIGVFTVESTQDTPFDSTMADVVIRLHSDADRFYFIRYLEIEKSRYLRQVYGKHFFKTVDSPQNDSGRPVTLPKDDWLGCGVVVFPSLHYIVAKVPRESAQVQ